MRRPTGNSHSSVDLVNVPKLVAGVYGPWAYEVIIGLGCFHVSVAPVARHAPSDVSSSRFLNLYRYLAFFFAAQYFFIRAACSLHCAAVKVRFFLAGAGSVTAAVGVTAVSGFFGGRPRRFVGPCRASIARLSRSRSAMRRATMWSVVIYRRV
jgi:hypothetical protein